MNPYTPPSLWGYINQDWPDIRPLLMQQVEMVVIVMAISAALGVGIGLGVWRWVNLSEVAVSVAAAILTIPSLALLTIFIPPFGLGWEPTIIALVLYAQLPIIRNTVVGMRGVDPAVMESARAMGMGRGRIMFRIQFPLAWPVIVTGLRVSSMVVFGISAIAAYVSGPGLGNLLFSGLDNLGSFNALNQALTGAIGITLLALAFDLLFVAINRVTLSRGLRA